MKIAFFLLSYFLFQNFVGVFLLDDALAQNFFAEKVRKITKRKRAYFREGIFYKIHGEETSYLKSVRHFYSMRLGRERVVFDFKSRKTPKIYGMINNQEKKLYIDVFRSDINPKMSSLGKSELVEDLYFFPIGNTLSIELKLKGAFGFDVFYLENPGRLVVDIKK